VQTAGLLVQMGSICGAQSTRGVRAGPVAGAEIAEFSPGCFLRTHRLGLHVGYADGQTTKLRRLVLHPTELPGHS
jgi:hypothetical protein